MTVEEIDEAMLMLTWMQQEHKPYQTREQMLKDWERFRRHGSWRTPDPHKCGFWPYRPDYWDERYGKD